MKKKSKNEILKTTYLIMLAVLVLGACGMEAENTTIPWIMCGVSCAWFGLFFWANLEKVVAR